MKKLCFESETLRKGKLNKSLADEIWKGIWSAATPKSAYVVMSARHYALLRSEYRSFMDPCEKADIERGWFATACQLDEEQSLKFCVARIASGEVLIYDEDEWEL